DGALHRAPSPAVVAPWRQDRAFQPPAHLLVPPQARARARVAGAKTSRRRGPVVRTRRDQVPSGTGGGGGWAIGAGLKRKCDKRPVAGVRTLRRHTLAPPRTRKR